MARPKTVGSIENSDCECGRRNKREIAFPRDEEGKVMAPDVALGPPDPISATAVVPRFRKQTEILLPAGTVASKRVRVEIGLGNPVGGVVSR
jgi:hypothetical protein